MCVCVREHVCVCVFVCVRAPSVFVRVCVCARARVQMTTSSTDFLLRTRPEAVYGSIGSHEREKILYGSPVLREKNPRSQRDRLH